MKRSLLFVAAALGVAVGFLGVRALRRMKGVPYGQGMKIRRSIIVNRPASELYEHWRNLEMLPTLIESLKRVDAADSSHSQWELAVPGGMRFKWHAQVIADRPAEMIGWRSLEGSDIDLAGSVRFTPQPAGHGTEVTVALQYDPPGGKLGSAIATLFGEQPAVLVEEALANFKRRMEAGQVATQSVPKPPAIPSPLEDVDSASKDSFPASDPPAWTGTTGTAGA